MCLCRLHNFYIKCQLQDNNDDPLVSDVKKAVTIGAILLERQIEGMSKLSPYQFLNRVEHFANVNANLRPHVEQQQSFIGNETNPQEIFHDNIACSGFTWPTAPAGDKSLTVEL